MLFDTLQRLGRGASFPRYAGRFNAQQMVATAATTVIGAAMVVWTPLSVPMVLSGVLTVPSALLALALTEPPREHTDERPNFFATGRQAARRVRRSRPMWSVMLLMTAVTVAITTMGTALQPVVVSYGVPLWTLGLFSGTQLVLSALGGWTAHSLGQRIGLRAMLGVGGALAGLALFGGASGLVWLFPLFILPSFSWNAINPFVTDFLARRSPTRERATVLSIDSVSGQAAAIPVGVLVGVLVDRSGLGLALSIAAAGVLALVAVAYAIWSRSGDIALEPAVPQPS
jgi:hypothetical protein